VDHDDKQEQVRRVVREWFQRIEEALPVAENNHRQENRMPRIEFTRVFTPGRCHGLRLLNWKVWCQRYSIDLELLLRILIRIYSFRRKPSRDPSVCTLGIPVAVVTGVTCRQRIEDELRKIFPNGENRQDRRDSVQLPVIKSIPYDNFSEMILRYGAEMKHRHQELGREPQQQRRNYRA